MTSKIIDNIEKSITTLELLSESVTTPVERVDICDIIGDLKSGLEKLQALQCYQQSQDTNYDELWEERKTDINAYREARDAWIRTEIFTMLLKGTTVTH